MDLNPAKFIASAAEGILGGLGELFTSDDERNKAAVIVEQGLNKVYVSMMTFINAQEKERTERHKYDMNSDSWLSKNIRPLTLVVLTTLFVMLIIWDSMPVKNEVGDIKLSAITVNELRLSQESISDDGSLVIPSTMIPTIDQGFTVRERWITLLENLLMAVYGFYFLSRGFQACVQSYSDMRTKTAGSSGLK